MYKYFLASFEKTTVLKLPFVFCKRKTENGILFSWLENDKWQLMFVVSANLPIYVYMYIYIYSTVRDSARFKYKLMGFMVNF
jgi:hypothetical protein